MIKLIALDLDGTLLNRRKQVTDATVEALQAAADRGIHVVLATGRMLSECSELLPRLPMIRYAVTCTGTQVLDLTTGETLFQQALTADEMRRLSRKLLDLDGMLQIFDDRDGRMHNSSEMIRQAERFCGPGLARTIRNTHGWEDDLAAYIAAYEGPSNKLHMFFGSPEAKAEALRRLEGEPYELLSSQANDLEIMPLGVDKATGLSALAERLGLTAAEVMAIGDGDNDMAMLQYAGLAVAMGNGSAGAKACAHRITEDNEHDGAAAAVWNILEVETYGISHRNSN